MNLFIFNNLNNDDVVTSLFKFKSDGDEDAYYQAARNLISFSKHRLTDGNIIDEYILRLMLEQDNLPNPETIRDFLRQDIKTVYDNLLCIDWDKLCISQDLVPISSIISTPIETGLHGYARSLESMMNSKSREALMGAILAHAEVFGTGSSSAFAALKWECKSLKGIYNTDPITFDDLCGLEYQKRILIANTESFMCGKPANDVLLTGSSGTGKSSCVKASLNMFKDRGLRFIELKKSDLDDLPLVFRSINNQILKYIIFIDDLSFEPDDMSYKLLKVALDGQAETRGGNVLIYATSNRRNLIKETWADREGGMNDEIHRSEALSERKSLAARFGINLSFLTPTQKEYLNIVSDMLRREDIQMDENIRSKALTWQIQYNGFSGRTAAQFVSNFLSEQ